MSDTVKVKTKFVETPFLERVRQTLRIAWNGIGDAWRKTKRKEVIIKEGEPGYEEFDGDEEEHSIMRFSGPRFVSEYWEGVW